MLRSWEKRGWGGADSSWVSTLLRRRTLRKREELWRQGEREVGLRGSRVPEEGYVVWMVARLIS